MKGDVVASNILTEKALWYKTYTLTKWKCEETELSRYYFENVHLQACREEVRVIVGWNYSGEPKVVTHQMEIDRWMGDLADRDLQTGVMDSSGNIDCGPAKKPPVAAHVLKVNMFPGWFNACAQSFGLKTTALSAHENIISEDKIKIQNQISF